MDKTIDLHIKFHIRRGNMSIRIVIDSCCDLTQSYYEDNTDVFRLVTMPVEIDGIDFFDDFGKSMAPSDFYGRLREHIMPNTAQINQFRLKEIFEEEIKAGNEVIYLAFTSGMSGTYNNALMARAEVLENYPEAIIGVVDTLAASVGEGVLAIHVLELVRKGMNFESIMQWVEENKIRSQHWFAVDDLVYLKHGGRVSAATATVGTVLNIKPILTLDGLGKIKNYTNVRGRKKSIHFLVEKLEANIVEPKETILVIGHGDCEAEAQKLKETIESKYTLKAIHINPLSATIGSHVGPNMISLAFLGNKREF